MHVKTQSEFLALIIFKTHPLAPNQYKASQNPGEVLLQGQGLPRLTHFYRSRHLQTFFLWVLLPAEMIADLMTASDGASNKAPGPFRLALQSNPQLLL